MDRQLTVYLLIALLCILSGISYAYFAGRSKKRTRERQQREDRKADRERLAAKRIADNDGKALSDRFSTQNAPAGAPERRI